MTPVLLLLLGLSVVLTAILALKWHAFPSLLLAAALVGIATPQDNVYQWALDQGKSESEATSLASKSVSSRLADGFGSVCGKIGILIALASIIGIALMESGSADQLALTGLRWFGDRGAPKVFLGSGFLLGIPVFFDTVFYLLIPLGRAMARRTGKDYALYVMTIIGGASMAHSLVPPTPGPLFVASALNVRLDWMIYGGLAVGLVTSTVGYLYAQWGNRRWVIPVRDDFATPSTQQQNPNPNSNSNPDLPSGFEEKGSCWKPPFWLACLPIILPLVLIGGGTLFKSGAVGNSSWSSFIAFIGDKNVALGISAGIACSLWWMAIRRNAKPDEGGSGSESGFDSGSMREKSQSALAGAGSILLITAAGGAFGAILQQTGIAQELGAWLSPGSGWTLPLAFGVTTLIRTAQGSATVAMLTVAGIFSGLADPQTLGFHPVYLALAIGVGSKPFAWMNDSGFWIIGKLSQMTEGETIKTFSIMTTLMALSGLVVICLAAWLFPLTGR